MISVDPERLRSYNLSPQDVVDALDRGNYVAPSGNVTIKDQLPMVPTNATVLDPQELRNVPLKLGQNVYIRDVGTVADATDVPVGYGLVNGQKSVYLPVVKSASASTLSVVSAVKENLSRFQGAVPDDVKVAYEFDESPIVYRAIESVGVEGALGAGLTGLMVLLFLRDLRAVIIVVLNIPLALLGSIVVLNLTGNTINIMTLGGLALAIGILVDEGDRRDREHPHADGAHPVDVPLRAARGTWRRRSRGSWHPCASSRCSSRRSSWMGRSGRCLFVPLSLAVGASMITSYLLVEHAGPGPERLAAGEPPPRGRKVTTSRALAGEFLHTVSEPIREGRRLDGRPPAHRRPGLSPGCRRHRRLGGRATRPRAGSRGSTPASSSFAYGHRKGRSSS